MLFTIEEPAKNINIGIIKNKHCLYKDNLVISLSFTEKDGTHSIYLQKQTNSSCNACIKEYIQVGEYNQDNKNEAVQHFDNLLLSYQKNGYKTLHQT